MNSIRRKWLPGLAGAAGLLLVGALTPRAAKAVYSTPVSIVNTTAAAGIVLSADKATRIPYQSTQIIKTCSGLTNCFFPTFSGVPTGYRLVVQNVSGFLQLTSNSPAVSGYLEDFHLPNDTFWGLNAPIGGTGVNGQSYAGLNENVVAVFDAGEAPIVNVTANFLTNSPQIVTVSGYLENCSVVGCAAVQH